MRFRLPYITGSSQDFFNRQRISLLVLSVLLLFLCVAGCRETATMPSVPKPPGQPSSGPGGADYQYAAVTKNVYGEGDTQYWIFEPASPTPTSAPLIVFNHGWMGINPGNYGAWIDHLVKRGNIVVYPRYQANLRTPPNEMTGYAIIAVQDAIQRLQSRGHVTPELDKFAIVGHSLGGVITANMATLAASEGLPEPKAIMLVAPGMGEEIFQEEVQIADLSLIPATVLMLLVVCEEDYPTSFELANSIFNETPQISPDDKNFITMFSDYHGDPPLVADHFAPVAPDERYGVEDKAVIQARLRQGIHHMLGVDVNALDYYGFWKLFDGSIDAAFYRKNREYAYGNTSQQRYMGRWSDGKAVVELEITESP